MPQIKGIDVFIETAKVLSVYEEDRLIDVQWLSIEGTRRGIPVVNDSGNKSMPQPGDKGLVLGTGNHFYYLGTIEYNYKSKINGTFINPDTGRKDTAKQVESGETYLTNTKAKSWFDLSNSGDMSVMNGFMEGFKYLANLRLSKLIGKSIELASNGINLAIGTAIRNVPGKGEQPISGSSNGKALEALLQIAYMGVQSVRFHLGEIMDLVSGTVPELSSWGQRLKAILEVTAGAVPLGSLKIDEAGNTEVKSTTGDVHVESTVGDVQMTATAGNVNIYGTSAVAIDSVGNISISAPTGVVSITGLATAGVLLGGPLAIHQVLWGEVAYAYLGQLGSHYHAGTGKGNGPIDASTDKPIGAPATMLSLTVFTQ